MHDQFAQAQVDPRHVLRDPADDVDTVVELILRRLADGTLRL